MATFKTITSDDIKQTKSFLNQLVDFVDEDVSGSDGTTRKKYQVFVTGAFVGIGVTSSLFQTVFDQSYTLQTANELFDMTIGLSKLSQCVTGSTYETDASGKYIFPQNTLMMREKMSIYRQYAQLLLGDANSYFYAPMNSSDDQDRIDEPLFLNFKRLFVRDGIKRETFAMRFMRSASYAAGDEREGFPTTENQDNLYRNTTSGSAIFSDIGTSTSVESSPAGGFVGALRNAGNLNESAIGNIFYQQGIVIIDLKKALSASQHVSGTIDAVTGAHSVNQVNIPKGRTIMGAVSDSSHDIGEKNNEHAKFIPDFLVSASIDNIVDHIAGHRFQSGDTNNEVSITFQNNTQINSTLVFCRAPADEFNYSSNPSYIDSDGNIVVIDQTSETQSQKSFSFVTTIGLYDASQELLATAKLSRPVEKNDEKDLTFRVRLDF